MSQPEPDLAGKSALIFDDGLRAIEGHFYEYDLAVAQHHIQRGARVTLLCNREFSEVEAFERAGVEVQPLIARSWWSGDRPRPGLLREIAGHARQALHFALVLSRHLRARQYDLVFAPNASFADALAWALLRPFGGLRRAGRVVLLFRFTAHVDPDAPVARKFALWRWVFRRLRAAAARGQVAFVTDSTRLVREYRAAVGVDMAVVPSPRTMPARHRDASERKGEPLTFAMLGFSIWARGTDLFDRAIAMLLESGRAKGMRFVVQWHAPVTRPDGSRYNPSPEVAESDQVTLIASALSSQDYSRQFDTMDCMVLPYRLEIYRSQISGVAIEAACADIPMIYTADSWLADLAPEQAAGIAVPNEDAAALADAMAALAADYPRFSRQARASGARARALNSPHHFLRQLWTAQSEYRR